MVAHVKNITETIGVSDDRTRKFGKGIIDPIGVNEKPNYPRFITENVTVQEGSDIAAGYIRNIPVQPFSFADVLTRIVRKYFNYQFSVDDHFGKKLSKVIVEHISISDTLLRNANAVVFDLVIRQDEMNLDELAAYADSPPIGYGPFQIFYPGDYEYQKGMVGVRIRSADTAGRAGILGLKLNVDVPDVTDRGSAEVTALEAAGDGQHEVVFNKVFAVPPEVYPVFAQGPTAALPEIIAVTETGFTFILRDLSSPITLVEGEITWAAIGR